MKAWSNFLIGFLVLCILIDILLIGAFAVLFAFTQSIEPYILFPIFLIWLAIIETFLFRYYSRCIVALTFQGDKCVVKTHSAEYVLDSRFFYEVKEDISTGRTYVCYNDGDMNKKFIYAMIHFPYRMTHLNIDEMQCNMPNAVFK